MFFAKWYLSFGPLVSGLTFNNRNSNYFYSVMTNPE